MTSASIEDMTKAQVEDALRLIEHCYEQGWTDGLPVVPPLEGLVREFVAYSGRDGQEIIATARHLDRKCTVELAAANAVMAGCKREYFPVVLAAVEALDKSPGSGWAWCQSTTGQSQLIIINGPVRERLGFNSKVNVFGGGFRPNVTVGRAMRLIIMNALGIRPQEFDQSAQASPSKLGFCIAENEEESPWAPLHVEKGYAPETSVVTSFYANSTHHVMTNSGEAQQILQAIGRAMSSFASRGRGMVVAMGPQHAEIVAREGLSKAEVKRILWESWGELPRAEGVEAGDDFVHFGASPDALLLVIAGGKTNAISTVIPATGVSFDSQPVQEPA